MKVIVESIPSMPSGVRREANALSTGQRTAISHSQASSSLNRPTESPRRGRFRYKPSHEGAGNGDEAPSSHAVGAVDLMLYRLKPWLSESLGSASKQAAPSSCPQSRGSGSDAFKARAPHGVPGELGAGPSAHLRVLQEVSLLSRVDDDSSSSTQTPDSRQSWLGGRRARSRADV